MKSLLAERIPNRRQVENKSVYGSFPFNLVGTNARFHFAIWPLDFYRTVLRVDEPAKLSAVFHILTHFVSDSPKPVRLRSKLDHKIGAEPPELHAAAGFNLCDTALQRPRGIGRAAGSVWQNEASGRVASKTASIDLSPRIQVSADCGIARASERVRWSYDDKFPLGCHFKVEVGMLFAECDELRVTHRLHRQGCGKVPLH